VAFLWALTGLFRDVLHHGVSGCRCVCPGAMRFLRQHHQIGVLLLVVLVNRYSCAALCFQALQLPAVTVHFGQVGSDDRSLIPDYPAQCAQEGEQTAYVTYVLPDQVDVTILQDEYGHTVQVDADALSRSCGF